MLGCQGCIEELAGCVGAQRPAGILGALELLGGVRGIWGHWGNWGHQGVPGLHWGAGREYRGSGASRV